MDLGDANVPAASAPSSTWHLHWQAAVGQSFLADPALANRIRDRLIAAHARRGRVLVDYLILPTEIHLIAQLASDDTPGEVAGAIGNAVSRWVREVRMTRSPVMGGPFRSVVLDSEDAVRQEIRMLAWRPVVLRLCRGPTFYPNGAFRIAMGMRRSDGFDSRPLLRLFGDSPRSARPVLRRWVARRPTELDWRSWELARGLALAPSRGGPQPTGFRPVKTNQAAALVAMAGDGGVEAALCLLSAWVARKLGVSDANNLHDSQQPQAVRCRALVARIAVAHSLCSSAFVARYFRRAKATLSEQMTASRLRKADDLIVSTPMDSILEELASKDASRRPMAKTQSRVLATVAEGRRAPQ